MKIKAPKVYRSKDKRRGYSFVYNATIEVAEFQEVANLKKPERDLIRRGFRWGESYRMKEVTVYPVVFSRYRKAFTRNTADGSMYVDPYKDFELWDSCAFIISAPSWEAGATGFFGTIGIRSRDCYYAFAVDCSGAKLITRRAADDKHKEMYSGESISETNPLFLPKDRFISRSEAITAVNLIAKAEG